MNLKFELTEREVSALKAMVEHATPAAEAMVDAGAAGGNVKQGLQLEFGCSVIEELLKLASGKK